MEFIMDMVHHNPGEEPFKTKFLEPSVLWEYGYNTQVFKHINTVIDFCKYDAELCMYDDEKKWFSQRQQQIKEEISRAKEQGLKVYYHIDLFVLPKRIVERYKNEMCDDEGKILLRNERTLDIHRFLFNKIFRCFPEVDGLIIRVGETYLHDTPYHIGNGAISYGDKEREIEDFRFLLSFLRDEICEKHNKYLFFRTWDCFNDRFHSNLEYYLAVTDRVEVHEKLLFSIKHTCVDFWRRVEFNECIGKGKHRQIVEIQCQREYEGKGAFPMYVMDGVINGFEECKNKKGLIDLRNNPLVCGVYAWSRGGGWYGPYLKNEFWCDINAYVIACWANNTDMSEEAAFFKFTKEHMGLDDENSARFRALCLTASRAILFGRYIKGYDDVHLHQKGIPCGNWMRDDSLGGFTKLEEVFETLYEDKTLVDALNEKRDSVKLWMKANEIYSSIDFGGYENSEYIKTSIDYAVHLFNIIEYGWTVIIYGFIGDKTGSYEVETIKDTIKKYDLEWERYKGLSNRTDCATLYFDNYFRIDYAGLGASVDRYRNL